MAILTGMDIAVASGERGGPTIAYPATLESVSTQQEYTRLANYTDMPYTGGHLKHWMIADTGRRAISLSKSPIKRLHVRVEGTL